MKAIILIFALAVIAAGAAAPNLFVPPAGIEDRGLKPLAIPRVWRVIPGPSVPRMVRGRVSQGLRKLGFGEGAAGFELRMIIRKRISPSGQGYLLDLASRPDRVLLVGDDERGLWYGAQTFLDLLAGARGELPRLVIRDRPDIALRMFHQQGLDKGYVAGDRWTVEDLKSHVPRLIDAASRARLTTLYLAMEAGWINEADGELGAGIDPVMKELVRYGKNRMVDVMISVEFCGMPRRNQVEEAFRRIRAGGITAGGAHRLASGIRRPLCPVADRQYYLKAIRRALSWRPWSVAVSFNDFPPNRCEACRQAYGTPDIRSSGPAMADIANDVQRVMREAGCDAPLYFLPPFYGAPHWERAPNALPGLVSKGPRGMVVFITGHPDLPQPKALSEQYGARFNYWLNLTSNSARDKKIWFPVDDIDNPGKEASLRGRPGAEVLFNLGAWPGPHMLSAMMGGLWLWNGKAAAGRETLEKCARELFGPAAAPLVSRYAALVPWPVVWESLGRNIVEHVKGRQGLEAWMQTWERSRLQAVEAGAIARRIAGAGGAEARELGQLLEWNAERIRQDYQIARLLGGHALSGGVAEIDPLRAALRHLEVFIAGSPVIANDPKDAEVIARGFRNLAEFALAGTRNP